MARLSINEVTTYRWSFEEDVANYAAAGIRAMGVWRQKLADYGEDRGIELLSETGMAVSNLFCAGGFTGSEGLSFRESIEDTEEAIRLAAAMACNRLVVYSGGRNGHTTNHSRRLVIAALRELADVAREYDVVLAIEPMHVGCAAERTFLTDLSDAVSLIHVVDSPHVKLAFDTYHLGHDEQVVSVIPEIIADIAVVHLGDGRSTPCGEENRCPLGQGRIPLADMVRAMLDAGYQGDFDVELIGEEIDATDYSERITGSKRVFEALVSRESIEAV